MLDDMPWTSELCVAAALHVQCVAAALRVQPACSMMLCERSVHQVYYIRVSRTPCICLLHTQLPVAPKQATANIECVWLYCTTYAAVPRQAVQLMATIHDIMLV